MGDLVQLIKVVQPKVEAQSDKPDADALREFTSSIKIEQHKDRMVLTASLPLELVKKLATPMSDAVSGAPPADAGQASAAGR
jgi:cobalamin biosynthesis Co2+ chelatase CbiK